MLKEQMDKLDDSTRKKSGKSRISSTASYQIYLRNQWHGQKKERGWVIEQKRFLETKPPNVICVTSSDPDSNNYIMTYFRSSTSSHEEVAKIWSIYSK